MEDRFRFRVWFVNEKRYYDPRHNPDDRERWFNLAPDGELIWGFVGGYVEPDEDETPALLIEQCTGLKDKNDKLIYEGDILRICSTYETEEPVDSLAVVRFRGGAFDTNFHAMLLRGATREGNWECELLGNIHENPELLEEK